MQRKKEEMKERRKDPLQVNANDKTVASIYTAAFAKRLTNVCAIVCQTFLVKHLTTQQRCRHLPDVYYKRLSIVYFNKCLSDVYFISFLEHFLCV